MKKNSIPVIALFTLAALFFEKMQIFQRNGTQIYLKSSVLYIWLIDFIVGDI